MHKLQRMGLLGITVLLLLGFWAGLWYQGQRKGDTLILAAEGGAVVDGGGWGAGGDDGNGVGSGGVGSVEGAGDGGASPSSAASLPDIRESDAERLNDIGGYERGQSDGRYDEGGERSGMMAVHVVGQVASPGLYFLPPGSRIYDAVMEAEPEEDADLGRINMAQPVEDGMQIRVTAIGKTSPWDGDALVVRPAARQDNVDAGDGASGANAAGAANAGKININKASAKELEALPGIGPAYSQRIIQYREQNGAFKNIEDLQKVNGIGPAKMSELRELICVS